MTEKTKDKEGQAVEWFGIAMEILGAWTLAWGLMWIICELDKPHE